MALPRLGQYQLALQHPATAFADPGLRAATVETTPMGLPRVISGGFALTYHLKNGTHEWAVRCFHREASELGRRYAAIEAMIARAGPGPFVRAEYLSKGVQVEGGWYPVTKMPWLRAVPLNRFIEANLDRPTLARLAEAFRALVERLAALGVAHGDLQHGNILVDPSGVLTLVDYDGMFVPVLAGLPANESGHVNYQHPGRAGHFDATLDRFSAAVIYTALVALAAEPSLWGRYANGENVLFKCADFDDPATSLLFNEIAALPAARPLGERLATLCRADWAALPTLREFINARVGVAASATVVAPAAVARSQFDVLDGADRERLLHHEGDVVTVVGRVVATQQRWSRQRRPYVSVALGPDAKNGAALLLYGEALNFFMPAGQVLGAYQGRWVRATGLVSITHRRDAARTPRPMVTIHAASDVRLVDEAEARDLLAAPGAIPWYRAHLRVRPALAPRPIPAQTAAALNRLYGTPAAIPADSVPRSSVAPTKKGRPRKAPAKPRAKGGQGGTGAAGRRRKVAAAGGSGGEWWRHFLPGSGSNGRVAATLSSPALGRQVLSRLAQLILATGAMAVLTTVLLIRLLW